MPKPKVIRGTTPTLRFSLPFTSDVIKTVYVTFKQLDRTVLEKASGDDGVSVADNIVVLTLTQVETLKMLAGDMAIQIRLKSNEGQALASNKIDVVVEDVLKSGVI